MLFLFAEGLIEKARREFARFLSKCLHVERTCTRKNEKGIFIFLFFFTGLSLVKERKGNGKARRYSSEISRRNLGIFLSPWSSKNPDNFTARTIYGSVFVAKLLSLQLTFSRATENVSGRSWLLAVVKIAIEHAPEPRRRVAVESTARIRIVQSHSSHAFTSLLVSRATLCCQRYKFPCAWKFTLRSTFILFRLLSRKSGKRSLLLLRD